MMKEQQYKKERKQMKQTESSTFDESIMSFKLTDSIFDWDGLLHRLMGDEDLAKEIVDDYIKQIPFNFIAVKEALNKQDVLLVKREAHIIKGASGNVGALALQELAEQIEIAGEERDLVKAGLFVSKLDAQLEILKNTLTQPKGGA
jgi:two-component system sensor histidine kinase/response regulator